MIAGDQPPPTVQRTDCETFQRPTTTNGELLCQMTSYTTWPLSAAAGRPRSSLFRDLLAHLGDIIAYIVAVT
jgi:hypothetical protein